jgi:hypothetical protein
MHESSVHIAVAEQIPEDVHDLGVEDGGGFKVLASGGGPGEDEDSGADDGADAERGERPGAKGLLELVARFGGLGDELVDGLAGKKLARQRSAPASRLRIKPWKLGMDFQSHHHNKQNGHHPRENRLRRWRPLKFANSTNAVPR